MTLQSNEREEVDDELVERMVAQLEEAKIVENDVKNENLQATPCPYLRPSIEDLQNWN